MSSVFVTLGGADYAVPKMNVGQLEELAQAFELPGARRPFAILRIALKRAEPKIADIGVIEAGNDEIAAAVEAVLANSGFKKPEEKKDPNAKAPETAPGDAS